MNYAGLVTFRIQNNGAENVKLSKIDQAATQTE